jgi:hypothetical protein
MMKLGRPFLAGSSCALLSAPAAALLARWRRQRPRRIVRPHRPLQLRIGLPHRCCMPAEAANVAGCAAINRLTARQITGSWSEAAAVEDTAAQASRAEARSAVAQCQRCLFPSPRTTRATCHRRLTRADADSPAAPPDVGAWSGAGLSRILLHKPRAR